MSRRLPMIGSGSPSAVRPGSALPLELDARCWVFVCEAGLDVCAPWLSALWERYAALSGAPARVGVRCAALPLSAGARALMASWLRVDPADARAAFAGAPRWALVTDGGFTPTGAGLVVRLCDPSAARRGATDPAHHGLLHPERTSTAHALAAALASHARLHG